MSAASSGILPVRRRIRAGMPAVKTPCRTTAVSAVLNTAVSGGFIETRSLRSPVAPSARTHAEWQRCDADVDSGVSRSSA